MKLKLFETNK